MSKASQETTNKMSSQDVKTKTPTLRPRKGSTSSFVKRVLMYVSVFTVFFVAVFPYLWIILTSFKTRTQAQSLPPQWVFWPTIQNYHDAFITGPFSSNLWNSFFVSVISTLLALLLALPAAYAFSQLSIRGSRYYLFFILTTRMAPPVALALPLYGIFMTLQLRDTLVGLSVAHTTLNLSFAIWMLKGFYDAIPREIVDAARIDGLSHLNIVGRITIPMILPGLIVTAVFCIIFSWNDFFFAKVLVDKNGTLPIALLGLDTVHGTKWGQVAAVCTVITLPLVLFAWLVQKYIIRGMTYGIVE